MSIYTRNTWWKLRGVTLHFHFCNHPQMPFGVSGRTVCVSEEQCVIFDDDTLVRTLQGLWWHIGEDIAGPMMTHWWGHCRACDDNRERGITVWICPYMVTMRWGSRLERKSARHAHAHSPVVCGEHGNPQQGLHTHTWWKTFNRQQQQVKHSRQLPSFLESKHCYRNRKCSPNFSDHSTTRGIPCSDRPTLVMLMHRSRIMQARSCYHILPIY